MGESNKALRGDKSYTGYSGLDLPDTETLSRGDVGDITSPREMRLLYERENKRQLQVDQRQGQEEV